MSENLLKKVTEGRQYRPTAEMLRIKEENEEKKEMIVAGHACTFNQKYELYDDGEFRIEEQIDKDAFNECDMSDVIFQYNHEGRVFARTKNNTLELSTDETGLMVNANLGGTEEGRKLFAEIRDKYTDKMSFGFTVKEDKREWIRNKESNKSTLVRTITKIGKLYDVSAVSIPANDGTDISARKFSDGVIAEFKAERLKERESMDVEVSKAKALLNL